MSGRKKPKLPTGIFARERKHGFVYYIAFMADGKQHQEKVGTDLRAAKGLLARRKREVNKGTHRPGKQSGRITVDSWGEEWLRGRHDVITVDDDRARLKKHVAPMIGKKRVEDVESRDVLGVLNSVRRKKNRSGQPLSETTVKHVYTTMSTMFADALQEGIIFSNPCADLRRSQRPRRPKRAHTQRQYHTQEQLEALISDERIPWDRRVFYAFRYFTGTRPSEAIGVCWEDYDASVTPLGRIHLFRQWHTEKLTYTGLKGKRNEPGIPRDIPVHPTLASMLASWKIEGFPKFFGRFPRPEDPIVPSRRDKHRSIRHSLRRFKEDCVRIGVPPLTQHESRNTFVTLAAAGGAPEAWIERITHNASGGVLSGYQVNDWQAMCDAVLCIRAKQRVMGVVIPIRRAASDETFYDESYVVSDTPKKNPSVSTGVLNGVDGTRTRGLRRDRPAL